MHCLSCFAFGDFVFCPGWEKGRAQSPRALLGNSLVVTDVLLNLETIQNLGALPWTSTRNAKKREQMKAITVEPQKTGTARLEDIPEPDLRDGSLLVEGVAVGVCSTDIGIENFTNALQRKSTDIKVVIRFGDA